MLLYLANMAKIVIAAPVMICSPAMPANKIGAGYCRARAGRVFVAGGSACWPENLAARRLSASIGRYLAVRIGGAGQLAAMTQFQGFSGVLIGGVGRVLLVWLRKVADFCGFAGHGLLMGNLLPSPLLGQHGGGGQRSQGLIGRGDATPLPAPRASSSPVASAGLLIGHEVHSGPIAALILRYSPWQQNAAYRSWRNWNWCQSGSGVWAACKTLVAGRLARRPFRQGLISGERVGVQNHGSCGLRVADSHRLCLAGVDVN